MWWEALTIENWAHHTNSPSLVFVHLFPKLVRVFYWVYLIIWIIHLSSNLASVMCTFPPQVLERTFRHGLHTPSRRRDVGDSPHSTFKLDSHDFLS
jgi:hypothetical protein